MTLAHTPPRIVIAEVTAGGGVIGIAPCPGQASSHSADFLAADLDRVAEWNAAFVLTLISTAGLTAAGVMSLGAEVQRRHMVWSQLPIDDFGVPDAAFESAWPRQSAVIRSLLARGNRVLIHCKHGLGRSGMIAARLLIELGVAPASVVARVRTARPGAIETAAQAQWAVAGRPMPLPLPDRSQGGARDRAVGALLGLAIGDALGTTLEFEAKPTYAVLQDIVGCGPFDLRAGEWTDDTSMALALADSLLHDPALDPHDLMGRFVSWKRDGNYSCTGACFDIGNATRASLEQFMRDGNPIAGSVAADASGNGALMRLAPVAIRHWRHRDALQRVAVLQTRTTHGAPATVAASLALGGMLAQAIGGEPLPSILASPDAAIEGGWKNLPRAAVEGSGHVTRSLQAAIWAVSRSTDFRSAVLLAANLGDDADTTAAIAGQLAGATYGATGIPGAWLAGLAWRDRLETAATDLFTASLSADPAGA